MRVSSATVLLTCCLVCATICIAQQGANPPAASSSVPAKKSGEIKFKHGDFTFVRIKYTSSDSRRQRSWATDYPDSDVSFSARFERETGLKTSREGKVLELTDPQLRKYPFIYLIEPGAMRLSDAEVVGLREYLKGGGFLMFDDFWGEAEWENVRAEMKRVFPDKEPAELPIEHAIFHSLFDLKAKPQVPNIATAHKGRPTGATWEREDGKEPHYRAIFDERGRMLALFCHNTDLGDGWEREGEDPWYYQEFSEKRAYPMGINIVVYVLTR